MSIIKAACYNMSLCLSFENWLQWLCWVCKRRVSFFCGLCCLGINRALELVISLVLTNCCKQPWSLLSFSAFVWRFVLFFLHVFIYLTCEAGSHWLIWRYFITWIFLSKRLFICLQRIVSMLCDWGVILEGYWSVILESIRIWVYEWRLIDWSTLSGQVMCSTAYIEAIKVRFVHDTLVEIFNLRCEVHTASKGLSCSLSLPWFFREHLDICLMIIFASITSFESRVILLLDWFKVRKHFNAIIHVVSL